MLVESGRVVSRGNDVRGDGEITDLSGKYLLPALTDCHCHILATGIDLLRLNLDGCETHEEVLDAVKDRGAQEHGVWLVAVHYDQNRMGGMHLTRHDLDKISTSRPIFLQHVNGHASVANSVALEAAGLQPNELDPDNGKFGRDADGSVNGVLFEGAHERVRNVIPRPTLEESVNAILRAGESMAALGIGCATDMQTETTHLEAYRLAAERGCKIKLRLYMVWRDLFGPRPASSEVLVPFVGPRNGSAPVLAGVKLFADGAIGSATAAIYGSYAGQPSAETSGNLMYTPEVLTHRVKVAHDAGFQIATHAIGDHALDVVLDAYESTGDPKRHRIEHAMLLSDSQIERLSRSGCSVAMQPEFLLRFRHAYLAQLGPDRAKSIKRCRSVLDAGIPLAFSSDRPICAGDPWVGVETASNRPDGYDPNENLTRVEAIERYLGPSADINGDGGVMGRLEPGEELIAAVSDSNPLAGPMPSSLTILQGK